MSVLIFFDLETNGFKNVLHREIIQLGAVKLIVSNDQIKREYFTCNVNPDKYQDIGITDNCRMVTNLTEKDLEDAVSFSEMVERFKIFLGEDYTLFSWDDFDFNQLLKECHLNGINADFLFPYIDLQKVFQNQFRLIKKPSLRNSLIQVNGNFQGKEHTALDDSINLYQVYEKMDNHQKKKPYFDGISFLTIHKKSEMRGNREFIFYTLKTKKIEQGECINQLKFNHALFEVRNGRNEVMEHHHDMKSIMKKKLNQIKNQVVYVWDEVEAELVKELCFSLNIVIQNIVVFKHSYFHQFYFKKVKNKKEFFEDTVKSKVEMAVFIDFNQKHIKKINE